MVAAADHTQRLTPLQHLYPTAVALRTDTSTSAARTETWPRSPSGYLALAPRRATDEHLLLACVGVARAQQGQGLGAATVAPGLLHADQEGLAVHLETSEARNLRFYHRLGFTITYVVDLPDGGPRTWLMRRQPGDAVRS